MDLFGQNCAIQADIELILIDLFGQNCAIQMDIELLILMGWICLNKTVLYKWALD